MQSIFGKISRAVARAPVNIQDGELHDNDVVNLSNLDAYEGPAYAFEHVADIFQTIFLRCLVLYVHMLFTYQFAISMVADVIIWNYCLKISYLKILLLCGTKNENRNKYYSNETWLLEELFWKSSFTGSNY